MNLLQSIKNTFNKWITIFSCNGNQEVVQLDDNFNEHEHNTSETKDNDETNHVQQKNEETEMKDENIIESENHCDTSEFVFNEVASNNEYDI